MMSTISLGFQCYSEVIIVSFRKVGRRCLLEYLCSLVHMSPPHLVPHDVTCEVDNYKDCRSFPEEWKVR